MGPDQDNEHGGVAQLAATIARLRKILGPFPREPSIVDRIASLGDPLGSAAERVGAYDEWILLGQPSLTGWGLPFVRKTAPRLLPEQIVSVQPMTQPIGGLAFYRPHYGAKKPTSA